MLIETESDFKTVQSLRLCQKWLWIVFLWLDILPTLHKSRALESHRKQRTEMPGEVEKARG